MNLRDMSDEEMLNELPPAFFNDGTLVRDEVARRLADLRADLGGTKKLRAAWRDACEAAEADRDRLAAKEEASK